ncbi:hypothetical protein P280DRAFT_464337 [Massarina eburnea CBS 473.64]|uniref:Uncharacterized protein n=1 Tax=Massarina eburnea CBS 473.64 TaxID=1395130 RepID=A0A6A6SGK9_9PLEO|nr:hypothetical protein P280DRAFT_464337 [Massarina eburnea CBS 473.64]
MSTSPHRSTTGTSSNNGGINRSRSAEQEDRQKPSAQQPPSGTPRCSQLVTHADPHRSSKCPYHTPILQLDPGKPLDAEMSPMERFLHISPAHQPLAILVDMRIGSAASAGCTCGQARTSSML